MTRQPTPPASKPTVTHFARTLHARRGVVNRRRRTVALCAAIELRTTTDPRSVTCRRCLAKLGAQ